MMNSSMQRIVSAAVAIAIFSGCTSSSEEMPVKPEIKEDSSRQEIKSTGVRTIIARTREFTATINSNGKVRSLKEQQFIAQAGGNIIDCNAEAGARCTAGVLILQMETTLLEIKVNRATQALFNGQKEYESLL